MNRFNLLRRAASLSMLFIGALTPPPNGAWGQDAPVLPQAASSDGSHWNLTVMEAAKNSAYKKLSFEFDYLMGRTAVGMSSRVHFEFSHGRFLSRMFLQGENILVKNGTNLLLQAKRTGQGDETAGFDGTYYYSLDSYNSTMKVSTDPNKIIRHMVGTYQRNPIINPWFQVTNFQGARVFPAPGSGHLDFSSAFREPTLLFKHGPQNSPMAAFQVFRLNANGPKLVSEGSIDRKSMCPVAFKSDFGDGRGLQWSVSELVEIKNGSSTLFIPKEIKYEEILRKEEGKSLSAYTIQFLPETFRFKDFSNLGHFVVPAALARTIDNLDTAPRALRR